MKARPAGWRCLLAHTRKIVEADNHGSHESIGDVLLQITPRLVRIQTRATPECKNGITIEWKRTSKSKYFGSPSLLRNVFRNSLHFSGEGRSHSFAGWWHRTFKCLEWTSNDNSPKSSLKSGNFISLNSCSPMRWNKEGLQRCFYLPWCWENMSMPPSRRATSIFIKNFPRIIISGAPYEACQRRRFFRTCTRVVGVEVRPRSWPSSRISLRGPAILIKASSDVYHAPQSGPISQFRTHVKSNKNYRRG